MGSSSHKRARRPVLCAAIMRHGPCGHNSGVQTRQNCRCFRLKAQIDGPASVVDELSIDSKPIARRSSSTTSLAPRWILSVGYCATKEYCRSSEAHPPSSANLRRLRRSVSTRRADRRGNCRSPSPAWRVLQRNPRQSCHSLILQSRPPRRGALRGDRAGRAGE
jgi:hypothetical protein